MGKARNKLSLFFEDIGNGFPVLFLHPFPLSGSGWVNNASAVRVAGYRTIVPDFPGFGRSNGLMAGIPDSARHVLDILENLRISSVAVCGMSMGGYVAFELIRAAPGRIAAAIFCGTNPDEDSASKKNERRETIKSISKNGTEKVMDSLARSLISSSTRNERPLIAENLVTQFNLADEAAVCAALESMAVRADSNDLLNTIQFPVKLIYGADDPMLSSGIKLDSSIKGASLEIIPDSGHFPNLESPDKFNKALLQFLEDTNL